MTWPDILEAAVSGRVLSADEMRCALDAIFGDEVAPEQTAAFLTALRLRQERAVEVLAAVRFLKSRAIMIEAPKGAIDTCGTGGDGLHTYNISTAVAVVVAGCGVTVAKHGNKAASSASGSSDVLTELGVDLTEAPQTAETRLHEDGIAFLFAPNHHSALAKVAAVRKALGFRTLFNMLGPLMNPARARKQLIGVFSADLGPLFADVLSAEGSESAWIVHGADGLDELSLSGINHVTSLRHGTVTQFEVTPEDAGLRRQPVDAIRGGSPRENAAALSRLLNGETSAYRDCVVFNAAAALIVSGHADDLRSGVALASGAIDSGAARTKLEALTRPIPS